MNTPFNSAIRIAALWAAIGGVLLFLGTHTASAHPCPAVTTPPSGTPGDIVVQEFPPEGPMETAWKVRFAHATGQGLYITGAWFKRGPTESWMRVLWDARVSEIFVPYHPGSPRYFDLTDYSFPLVVAGPEDAGPCGTIIDGKIIKQVRTRGLAWKDDQYVRYGHELALWATLDSANYNYVMSYAFRDDGTIALRIGATSRNLPFKEYIGHMHDALWRIDMDLNGYLGDTAYVASHHETTGSNVANDTIDLFNGGEEGWLDWEAEKFTEVHLQDTAKNQHGNNISYEFKPVRRGTPRHKEPIVHHDFWITRYHGSETVYREVNKYINGESVSNSDVVVWHASPAHHNPRDEDGYFDEDSLWNGVALLMWTGIDLRPRNLFSKTPLFP